MPFMVHKLGQQDLKWIMDLDLDRKLPPSTHLIIGLELGKVMLIHGFYLD